MNPEKKVFFITLLFCSGLILLLILIRFTMSHKSVNPIPEMEQEASTASDQEPLPDTSYSSALVVHYEVRHLDTLANPILRVLEDAYQSTPGVFTFRGGPLRDYRQKGTIDGRPSRITVAWAFQTDFDTTLTDFGRWGGGTGWTGQPLVVHWPDSLSQRFSTLHDTLIYQIPHHEVIFGSLCGKVYFVDYETGKPTRRAFNLNNPIKGTPALDPSLNGLLFVGHGIPRGAPIGFTVFDLFSHQKKQFFAGKEPFARRGWGAFDSSPVMAGQFLFWPGENGVVYKFLRTPDGLKLHTALRYTVNGSGTPGIESSMALFKNYGYFGDNHGNILCINLNTMKPVWHYHNLDDTDASVVIEVENGIPYLYTGCEVDRQGNNGFSQISKINGLNGTLQWQIKVLAKSITRQKKRYNGGMLATPLLGQGASDELLFCIISLPDSSEKSDLMAIRKRDGHTVWKLRLDAWSWSSPAPFYASNDSLYMLVGDVSGMAYLIDAQTGDVLFKELIGQNFESSPLVWRNTAIFGSRGRRVFKLVIE